MKDDLLTEFMAEATEGLSALDADILLLERRSDDMEIVNRIFRIAHSIKGGAGFVNLPDIAAAAHRAEELLDLYRKGKKVTGPAIGEILSAFDGLRALLLPKSPAQAPEESLRVRLSVIDAMLENLGEAMLAQQALTDSQEQGQAALALRRAMSSLQGCILEARMQPVQKAWENLPRLVRDLSGQLGRRVRLEMQGGDTGIDRQLLESLRDPLTQMIRNAIDHGIEPPAVRVALGKAEEGVIRLSARHEGGQVVVDMQDDGKGIDLEKLKGTLVARGLLDASRANSVPEDELLRHVFMPGLSTAGRVTDVSGRGVGLDVVRANIDRIGGNVSISTVKGAGTHLVLRLPLTLAVVPSLVIRQGAASCALPQTDVQEIVRLEDLPVQMDGAAVLPLRGVLLPFLSLRDILGTGNMPRYGVVVHCGAARFVIGCDGLRGVEDIIIRPLSPLLHSAGIYSGQALLAEGDAVMILDAKYFAAMAGNIAEAGHETAPILPQAAPAAAYLLFETMNGGRAAAPLSLVRHLDEIDVANIEKTAQGDFVLYQQELISLSNAREVSGQGRQKIVVLQEKGGRPQAMAVRNFLDVVEENIAIHDGVAILAGHAADIVGMAAGQSKKRIEERTRRVLLIDDSAFFRDVLTPGLEEAGYRVLTAASGAAALVMRDKGVEIDVIVSDIEMPGMDGFDFAQRVKAAGSPWRHVPLLALSAHATARDREKGLAAGFDDYITKFDRDSLLAAIARAGGKET